MVLRKWESRSSPPKESKARANARALFVISRRLGSPASAARDSIDSDYRYYSDYSNYSNYSNYRCNRYNRCDRYNRCNKIPFSTLWIESEQSYKQSQNKPFATIFIS